jgi:serine/threonine protein kinase
MRHPGILKIIGCTKEVFGKPKDCVKPYVVMEFQESISLYKVLYLGKGQNGFESWSDACKAKCVFGIAAIMRYVHARNIIHRDVKMENVLLDKNFEVVICDFGTVNLSSVARTQGVGTPLYDAPEVMFGPEFDEEPKVYGCEVDVFSYAVLLRELFTNDRFLDVTINGVAQKICLNDINIRNESSVISSLQFFFLILMSCVRNKSTRFETLIHSL